MNTRLHRLGIAVLLVAGVLGVFPIWQETSHATIEVQHRDFMLGLLSATLFLSTFARQLRLAAIAASVLSKLAFIAVAVAAAESGGEPVSAQVWLEVLMTAALLATGIVLWREARREARWDGMLPLRTEA